MSSVAPLPTSNGNAVATERLVQKVVLPGQTPEGQHILSILVKRTYRFAHGKACERAEVDQKIVTGDVHYGDPMNTTVKHEADFVPFKLATDVVLNGFAYAPGGRPTAMMTASLELGQFRKDVRVFGDRVVRYNGNRDPSFTDPKPFTKMELRYERAYGGVDIYSDLKVQCPYIRNPLGRGFAVTTAKRAIDELPLPNLESPTDLLTPARLCPGHFMYWEKQPIPTGFGWYGRTWQPRGGWAGVMPADRPFEQEMRQHYATLLTPEDRKTYLENPLPDMDFRFFNGASHGLVMPYLNGDEEVRLTGLMQEGNFAFRLPGDRPKLGLDIGEGVQEPEVVLQTVMFRAEEKQVDLVWRGAVPYPGPDWFPQMRKMEVYVQ
jgi:hypothetical protein